MFFAWNRCFPWKGQQHHLFLYQLHSFAQKRYDSLILFQVASTAVSTIHPVQSNMYFILLVHQAHGLQLEAFALALTRLDPDFPKPKLQFVGSCRNQEDLERLQKLKDRAIELHINELVEFHKDISYMYVFNLIKNFHTMSALCSMGN